MKFTTLLLSVACAVGFSSCCCQTQPMPNLRPFPKDCQLTTPAPAAPQAPVKVFEGKGK